MILGKFLGMLVFWPYCALDDLGSPGAITEAAAIADHSSAQIDLNRILDDALADGRLDRILTQVPWICEMVKMAPASVAQTAYFNRTVSLLTSIPRSFSSASTTCISVCIEQLCAVWRVDLSSTPSKIDLHNQRISQQDRVDRVLFTASGHLEQVLGVLRLSTAESGRWQRQNEQQRTITPSLSTLHPPVEIASALPSMVSVLRKDFFSSNPEIASLLPMIIDRIVPDVVSLSVGSVCRSSIATALSNEDRADIDMMQLSLDDADSEYVPEKVIEDAKVKCQRLCLDQCRLRVVPALEALAPRSGRPDSDALIVNQTIDLAMEHAANMIHEQISKRFPEVFKSVWEPMIKKRRRAALSSPKPTRSHPILSQSNAVPDLSDICDFLGRVDPIAAVDDSVDGRDLWTIVFLELTHKLSPSMAICCCVCQDQPCSCQSSICPLARSAFDSMTNGLRSMEVASLRGVIRSILSDCGGGKCCSSWPYVLAGLAIQVPSSRLIVESLLVNSSVISATDSEKVEFVRCFHKGCRIDHHPLQFLRLIANSTQSPSSVIADLFHIPTV
uniref:Uncharacterized protein n=1 Tax=Spongospora subterranea TaxID=70186 RepID=A0A0H5QYK9_9EUKA|eukprot:CRZ00659.1 hypothetical protein [Spongospora subterranea]